MEQTGKTHEVGVHHGDDVWRRCSQQGWGSKSVAEVSLERPEQKAWRCAEDDDSVRQEGGSERVKQMVSFYTKQTNHAICLTLDQSELREEFMQKRMS